MLEVSQEYLEAMTATRRRIVPRVKIDIIDPDMTALKASAADKLPFAQMQQVTDEDFVSQDNLITLERNRWVLDGSFLEVPEMDRVLQGIQIGYISDEICGADGVFASPPELVLSFSGVTYLSACGIVFSGNYWDGFATDFDVIIDGPNMPTITVNVIGNTRRQVPIEGFSGLLPSTITFRFKRWSLPCRHARVIEAYPGVLEEWDDSQITDLDVVHETDLTNLSLPNGSCTMTFYNEGNRFNPYNKSGLFSSLEARQSVQVFFGADVGDDVEYAPAGVFYMTDDCWRLNSDGMTMTFEMADLIGLVKERMFSCPATPPTTLSGWLRAVLSTLGSNFAGLYTVDDDVLNTSMTVEAVANVDGQSCGDVLCWLAQASLGFMRCDPVTGRIRVSAWPSQPGVTLGLADMSVYPVSKNRGDVAKFVFRYYDNTEYTIPGTQDAADKDISIHNPFIAKNTIAGTIMSNIKKCYGTAEITVRGRGNPASEIGDIDTITTWMGQTPTAYRISQQLRLQNGVMADVQSQFLEVKDG